VVEIWEFNPRKGYWFTSYLLEKLQNRSGCFPLTLDIGLSDTVVCVEKSLLRVGDHVFELNAVKPRREDHVVFYDTEENRLYEVVVSAATGYYKLKAIGPDKAPTLEINGIHMHRITGIDPWSDAKIKVEKLGVKRGDTVLDTCLGLGYTAVNSLKRGARAVYSVEIDESVLWIAERNPWSRELGSGIVVIRGDVVEEVAVFPENYFDKILHDPPRYSSSTGNLYSLEFYRELYRVLKPGGKLYHYTGEPGKHRGAGIVKGIGERLRRAGFYPVFFDEESMGYIAFKPRL